MAPKDHIRRRDVLIEALERRACRCPSDVTAYRLLNGPGDGAPAGLTLDRYDRWLVLAARAHVPRSEIQRWAEVASECLDPAGMALKVLASRVKDSTSEVLLGELPPGRIVVEDGPARLLCALDDGVQTGLFLDHRETRWLARRFAEGVEVLNLFSYTCAFSVHAALGGATRVTSVDVSKKALEWGRENMRANDVSDDTHRWFADDVVRHVTRGPDRQYGLAVLDPPVFGRAKGRAFSLTADLSTLLEGTIRKLDHEGVLLFSTHAQVYAERDLIAAARSAGAVVGRKVTLLEQRGLPEWDHPIGETSHSLTEDRGNYLKTLVLRIEDK